MTRRRVTIPYRAKVLYVRSRPELWSRPLDLTREMVRLGYWAKSTSVRDAYRSVRGIVAKVRRGTSTHLIESSGPSQSTRRRPALRAKAKGSSVGIGERCDARSERGGA